jgi:hypothetical protein
MKALPFDKPGRWFRGNLHTHSNRSDGLKTPEQLCRFYQHRGYSFLCVSDHFTEHYNWPLTDTTSMRTRGFTTLLGAELHAPKTSLGDDWHILAVGLPVDFPPLRPNETGPRLANRARRAGAYVAVAHPAWYDLSDKDVLSIKAAHAIEIQNMTCLRHNGKGDSTGYLDRLLSTGHRYHAIACDDAHFAPARKDCCAFWVNVRSTSLDPQALLDALRHGHFYSSAGPRIENVKYNRRRRTITVETSPVRAIRVIGVGFSSAYTNFPTDQTRAEFDVGGLKGPYARLTIEDRRGKRAWSNPFWF